MSVKNKNQLVAVIPKKKPTYFPKNRKYGASPCVHFLLNSKHRCKQKTVPVKMNFILRTCVKKIIKNKEKEQCLYISIQIFQYKNSAIKLKCAVLEYFH